jgi:hypothetical protein
VATGGDLHDKSAPTARTHMDTRTIAILAFVIALVLLFVVLT